MKHHSSLETTLCTDALTWQKKARAFAVRARHHLWGKNNEDPLVFLYRQGISLDFAGRMSLGWNKFGQNRSYHTWGLAGQGSFFLPPGIVFPYFTAESIAGIYIVPMTDAGEYPESVATVPGSQKPPLILGPPDKKVTYAAGMMEGFRLFQDQPDKGCVHIQLPPRNGAPAREQGEKQGA